MSDLVFRELRWLGMDGESRRKLQVAVVEPTGTRDLVWEDVPVYDVSREQFFGLKDADSITDDQLG